MNVNRGRLSFWPASIPNEFHEMDAATVPQDVVLALQRSMSLQSESTKWGVTLPPQMQDQLTHFMNTAESGALVITARGDVQLEQ
jgi:ABC-type phosphate transport system auxiliary subunit